MESFNCKNALAVCLLVFSAHIAARASAVAEKNPMVGDWACVSGECPDEELSFTIEGGTQVYRSWLHERPSITDGEWQVSHNELTLISLGTEEKWAILSVS